MPENPARARDRSAVVVGIKDTGLKLEDRGLKIRLRVEGLGVMDLGLGVGVSGSGCQDLGTRMNNEGFKVQGGFALETLNLGCWISVESSRFWIGGLGHGFWDFGVGVPKPVSQTTNQKTYPKPPI